MCVRGCGRPGSISSWRTLICGGLKTRVAHSLVSPLYIYLFYTGKVMFGQPPTSKPHIKTAFHLNKHPQQTEAEKKGRWKSSGRKEREKKKEEDGDFAQRQRRRRENKQQQHHHHHGWRRSLSASMAGRLNVWRFYRNLQRNEPRRRRRNQSDPI